MCVDAGFGLLGGWRNNQTTVNNYLNGQYIKGRHGSHWVPQRRMTATAAGTFTGERVMGALNRVGQRNMKVLGLLARLSEAQQ
jgi:hypothetical protein